MTLKVIPFPDSHFLKTKKPAVLSKQMVAALLRACAKQSAGLPFGQMDIDGSFIPLVKRGLIVEKKGVKDNESFWQVTPEAILILKAMGIDTTC